MTAMRVELSQADEEIVRKSIEGGGFSEPQDVLHEALSLLEQKMTLTAAVQQQLHEKLVEGMQGGDPILVDEDYWTSLRAELEARRDSSR